MTVDDIGRYADKPLAMIPFDWRVPVWRFWANFAHLLPNQLALSMRLREWIESEGLTLAEAVRAFNYLTRPEQAATVQYPGQLLAALAAATVRAMEDRKRREQSDAAKKLPGFMRDITLMIGELPK